VTRYDVSPGIRRIRGLKSTISIAAIESRAMIWVAIDLFNRLSLEYPFCFIARDLVKNACHARYLVTTKTLRFELWSV
jgi:hypothetical protein